MGFDISRFQNCIREDLICFICYSVFKDPVQTPECQHVFCKSCITRWIVQQPTCPLDRISITAEQLRPAPKTLRNVQSKLLINCDHAEHGCSIVTTLYSLDYHVKKCVFDPKYPTRCEQGCNLFFPKDEMPKHDCFKTLNSMLTLETCNSKKNQVNIEHLKISLNKFKRETSIFEDYVIARKVSYPTMLATIDKNKRDEVIQWSQGLTFAKVVAWGGLISTPGEDRRISCKNALILSKCPIVENLMENCYENNWPPVLASFDTRVGNTCLFESYVCRRIPAERAIIVLQCDNPHIGDNLIIEHGFVIIFDHGIE